MYRIKWGDTLSQLAVRFGTSVGALMKANKQIKDPNLIYAGRTLNIPGQTGDSFESGNNRPSLRAAPQRLVELRATTAARPPPGKDPFAIAKSALGRNAAELKVSSSGLGLDMEDWVPNNVNCANFVSACLEQAGQISDAQHDNSVLGLQAKLDRDAQFRRVSLSDAKPGDVVCFNTGGGGHHVVMFAGWQNGRPMFIGSNNVNADGSQKVTMSSMSYPIASIHHYVG